MAVAFDVKGQKGAMPAIGLGTATLFDAACVAAVRSAIRLGYRLIDTALLYNNQEAVGQAIKEAIAAGEVTRAELFVVTKVAFYPRAATLANTYAVMIKLHDENKKGLEATRAAIALCLQKLQLEYVDLCLIHNPCTDMVEYHASAAPHAFELGRSQLTVAEREVIMQARLAKVKYDEAAGESERAASWKALEEAHAAGKCRFIGVSNYPTRLVAAMDAYATVAPAVNQLELHPRFSSPSVRAQAKERGMALTAYGSGNSVDIEKSKAVAAVAQRHGVSPNAVVLAWTLKHGVAVIPRSHTAEHQAENLAMATGATLLSDEDMAELDALNEAHPYYWSPLPLLPPGTPLDLCWAAR